MKYFSALVTFILTASVYVGTASAETIEELKAQLAAQQQVNELLKHRISTLEAELAGRAANARTPVVPVPAPAPDDFQDDRALERTLVHRGTALLPPHAIQVTPNFAWSHSGTSSNSSLQNFYGAGLEARYGLPGGWMVGASLPVLLRDGGRDGRNAGAGDFSAMVWKSLWTEQDDRPSLIASLRYTAPTGEDPAGSLPLGSGFHAATIRLSAVRSIAPIAIYGELYYTSYLGEKFKSLSVHRDGSFGFDVGFNLAVTPEISLITGVGFDFEDSISVNGWKLQGSSKTRGAVEIGAGMLLTRKLFLVFSATFGVTDDTPDIILGLSLPMRF